MLAKQKLAASTPARPALNSVEPFGSLNARWTEMTRCEDELMAETVDRLSRLGLEF